MIKVAIADDQTLLRDMLKLMLVQDSEIEVVGCAGNGKDIINICKIQAPDVVLMDIKMPVLDGVNALTTIKQNFPDIKVLMLTTFGDERNVIEAYKAGADGYVLKDIKPQTLVMTVKCIKDDLFVMHKGASEFIKKQVKVTPAEKLSEFEEIEKIYDEFGLDKNDRKIIKLLISGLSNKEIGEALNFSEGTVKNRISRILSVTGLKDRTQIAVFALKNNLV